MFHEVNLQAGGGASGKRAGMDIVKCFTSGLTIAVIRGMIRR